MIENAGSCRCRAFDILFPPVETEPLTLHTPVEAVEEMSEILSRLSPHQKEELRRGSENFERDCAEFRREEQRTHCLNQAG